MIQLVNKILEPIKKAGARMRSYFWPVFKKDSLYNLDEDFAFLKRKSGISFSFLIINPFLSIIDARTLRFWGGLIYMSTKFIDRIKNISTELLNNQDLKEEVRKAKAEMMNQALEEITIEDITAEDIKRHIIRGVLAHELGHSQQKIKSLRQILTNIGLESVLNHYTFGILLFCFKFFQIPFTYMNKAFYFIQGLIGIGQKAVDSAHSQELEFDADEYAADLGYRQATIFVHQYIVNDNITNSDRYFNFQHSMPFWKNFIFRLNSIFLTHPRSERRINNLMTKEERDLLPAQADEDEVVIPASNKSIWKKIKFFLARLGLYEPLEDATPKKGVNVFEKGIKTVIEEAVKSTKIENVDVYINSYTQNTAVQYAHTYIERSLIIPSNLIMQLEYCDQAKLIEIGKDASFKKEYYSIYKLQDGEGLEQDIPPHNVQEALLRSIIVSKMHQSFSGLCTKAALNAQSILLWPLAYQYRNFEDDRAIKEHKMPIIYSHALELGLVADTLSSIKDEIVEDSRLLYNWPIDSRISRLRQVPA
jgi:hypothetical protein